jgi:hypothetical protein
VKRDLRKFMPDVSRVLRDYSPEAIEERERKALENVNRPTPAGFFTTPDGSAPRASAPSPWAQNGAPPLDPAALPSATAPPPAEESPVTKAARHEKTTKATERQQKVKSKHVALAVALGLGVATLAVAMPALLTKRPAPAVKPPPSATATLQPLATTPSGSPAPPAPSVASSASPPAMTSPPSTAPSELPNRRHVEPKPHATLDDPYGDSGAPAPPPKTAEPAVPAPPQPKPALAPEDF